MDLMNTPSLHARASAALSRSRTSAHAARRAAQAALFQALQSKPLPAKPLPAKPPPAKPFLAKPTLPRAFLAVLGLALLCRSTPAAPAPAERKPLALATLAPKGSSYHKTLLALNEAWRAGPEGGVGLKLFTDGALGGEADMVRNMRTGRLQAAMLTVNGLRDIDPAVTALQNIPLAFDSLDEAGAVRERLMPRLERALAEKGFVALFWGDIGWVRFFTKQQVVLPQDMQRVKLFTWSGSTRQADLMKSLGWNPVLLETADILPGLQTGLIDGVGTVPYLALKGQFFQSAPHMIELDWAPLVGALVVTKTSWDPLPAALQAHCREKALEAGVEITRKSRAENDEAVAAMRERGLKVQVLGEAERKAWRSFVEPVWPRLRGLDVPPELYDELMRVLKELRAGSAPAGR
jgi:TRAP-type C4-dicarboxylate transport system substrate-binding protein